MMDRIMQIGLKALLKDVDNKATDETKDIKILLTELAEDDLIMTKVVDVLEQTDWMKLLPMLAANYEESEEMEKLYHNINDLYNSIKEWKKRWREKHEAVD